MTRARDSTCAHAADENIALPSWKAVTGVDGHAGSRDLRKPHDERRFEPVARGIFRNLRARIVPPEAHERPSVIATGQDDVDLIPTVGTVFVIPDGARLRMNDESQRIPVPEGEDLRSIASATCKRVVWRNRSIIAQSQDLAPKTRGLLCDLADVAAGRHVHHAVSPEDDSTVQTRVDR